MPPGRGAWNCWQQCWEKTAFSQVLPVRRWEGVRRTGKAGEELWALGHARASLFESVVLSTDPRTLCYMVKIATSDQSWGCWRPPYRPAWLPVLHREAWDPSSSLIHALSHECNKYFPSPIRGPCLIGADHPTLSPNCPVPPWCNLQKHLAGMWHGSKWGTWVWS